MKGKKEAMRHPVDIGTLEALEEFKTDYGHRCMFKAMGFTTEELGLPRIAVVNSWSEQSPGHIHLRNIAEGVKAGIRMAGGMPFEINVIGPCTMLGRTVADGANYDLPQREAILASVESALRVGWCEGWVGIGACDKIVPGMMLAAIRLNRPFIFIGGGQMIPSPYEGRNIGYVEGQEIVVQELRKLKDAPHLKEAYEELLEEVTDCCGSSAGACGEMSTGNTMALLMEALGFSLPGTSTSVGVSAEKIWQSKETGKRIVDMARKGLKPRDILTIESLKNAIAVNMAICGGTNSLVHLQCYAHEARIPLTLDTWDEVSKAVPALCGVTPSGPYVLPDLHKAGGVPAVMKRVEGFLETDCVTVTGETVKANLADVNLSDSDVIRPLDNPLWPEGSLAILRGNLAPRGAVTRHTIIENKSLLDRTFIARVFNSLRQAIEEVLSGARPLKAGDAVVIRYIGPRGGPAMPCGLGFVRALKLRAVKDVAIITDGRFSGFTKGYLAIGHVCPEAQVGGVLALLQDGDRIRVNIRERRLDVELSDDELARRRALWSPPDQSELEGVISMYAHCALQADEGAGWPARWSDFDAH
jgi:dihydroxy-acid dehydratase